MKYIEVKEIDKFPASWSEMERGLYIKDKSLHINLRGELGECYGIQLNDSTYNLLVKSTSTQKPEVKLNLSDVLASLENVAVLMTICGTDEVVDFIKKYIDMIEKINLDIDK